jgi:acyl-coenzyme A thioesterase PaaI-like protein
MRAVGADAPPDGEDWQGFPSRGPFSTHIGPFFHRTAEDGVVEHGFRVLAHHCNSYRILHGGMVLGFMDGVFAHAAFRALEGATVTVRLAGDNLDMARGGDWIAGRAVPLGPPGEDGLVTLDGSAWCGNRPLWRGMAVFKKMARRIG